LRPTALVLEQNAPNPFNPATTIRFSVPEASKVQLVICAVNGQVIRTLVNGPVQSGRHEVVWDGRDTSGREVASGVYLYRLKGEGGALVRKMLLVR
jgi:flagellar hook assembly protein FlgD